MPIVELTGFAVLALLLFLLGLHIKRKRKNALPALKARQTLPAPEPALPPKEPEDSAATEEIPQEAEKTGREEEIAPREVPRETTESAHKVARLDAIVDPQCFENETETAPGKAPVNINEKQMVSIQAGSFILGSPSEESGRSRTEGPRTRVVLSQGFWIARYPVTQQEYSEIMNANPSYFTGDLQRPVESVTWEEAMTCCELLTQRERARRNIPENHSYRLPTEAEWEYAARAGSDAPYSYGGDPKHENLNRYAWYYENSGRAEEGAKEISRRTTQPVGQKQPNSWGLHDVHGNVWEWCQDRWSAFHPGGALCDPQGPENGSFRVRRGGSWISQAQDCRSAARGVLHPSSSHALLGFRVVLAIDTGKGT
ncbi:MAG: formylglycine-generating enzyme family protein [Opitutales bacterium]